MFQKSTLAVTAFALVAGLSAAAGQTRDDPSPAIDPATRAAMDAACAAVQTQAQARTCLEPFYAAAMDLGIRIWQRIHAGGNIPDMSRMSADDRMHYDYKTFETACVMQYSGTYRESMTPSSFLSQPSWCLAYPSMIAEQNGIAFDRDTSEWLQARIDRLRHLDIAR